MSLTLGMSISCGGKDKAYPPTVSLESLMDGREKYAKQCRHLGETLRLEGLLSATGEEAASFLNNSAIASEAARFKLVYTRCLVADVKKDFLCQQPEVEKRLQHEV